MEISGKVFVVTGGGNGIGREVVIELLRRGGKVAAVDLNETGLKDTASLAAASAERLSLHPLDITNESAVSALPGAVIAKHGAVDAVLNIAGIIQPFVMINELEVGAARKVMAVNFDGVFNMVKSFLPELLKRPSAHLLNVSSMGAYAPVPGQTLYGASKAAVTALTNGLISELTDTNVRATVVFPGAIGTNIAQNSGVNIEMPEGSSSAMKTTAATEAARQIVEAIVKQKTRIWIGSDAKVMDRLTRISPDRAAKLIYSQMKALLKR